MLWQSELGELLNSTWFARRVGRELVNSSVNPEGGGRRAGEEGREDGGTGGGGRRQEVGVGVGGENAGIS